MEPEKFWYVVSTEKCGDELRFPHISNLMINFLSLPYSSAAAAIICSMVSNIKTKHPSRLQTQTLNGFLHSKALLQDRNCKNWQPSPDLLKNMTSTKSSTESTSETRKGAGVLIIGELQGKLMSVT